MFLIKRYRRAQAGDTIVEVLIVLTIVGLALSISYATATRSLQGVRQSEEHSIALQLVQSQLEQLRTENSSQLSNYMQGQPFCIVSGNVDPSTSCELEDNLYNLALTCGTSLTPCDNIFTAQATWLDVTGTGNDNVSLVYRYYP